MHQHVQPASNQRAWRFVLIPFAILFWLWLFADHTWATNVGAAPQQAVEDGDVAASPLCFTSLNGSSTYTSSVDSQAVRAAVAATASNGTVHVAGYCAGVTGNGVITQVVAITRPLTLRGGYQAISGTGTVNWGVRNFALYSTTLDALGSGRVITTSQPLTVENLLVQNGHVNSANGGGVYAGSTLWLIGSQLRNNVATGSSPNGFGGGAYVINAATITGTTFLSNTAQRGGGANVEGAATINGSSFHSNTAGERGGGVVAFHVATITGSSFLSNTAQFGGGVWVFGTATITGNSFRNNRASQFGGGSYAQGVATITGSSFLSNTASQFGGGAYVFSTATITGSSFLSNTAGGIGGGAFVNGAATIIGSNFRSNRAGNWGGGAFVELAATITGASFIGNRVSNQGGGLYLNGSSAAVSRVTNVIFARNQAASTGNAIYLRGIHPRNSLTVRHTTISSPTLTSGAAIHVVTGTVNLTNTIIANQTIGIEQVGGTVGEDYSLFDGVNTPFSGTVSGGLNSITGTAAFVDALNDNYRLTAASTAIDTGVDAGVINDYDQANRPQGSAPDLGAFESTFDLPTIEIGDGSVIEGDSGSIPLTLPVTLSFAKGITVTVHYTITPDSASEGGDYTGVLNSTLIFAPGSTLQSIEVSVIGDVELEADETFTVTLGEARYATINNTTAAGTIIENDTPTPTVTATPTATSTSTATPTATATTTGTTLPTQTGSITPTVTTITTGTALPTQTEAVTTTPNATQTLLPTSTSTPIAGATPTPGGTMQQVYLPVVTK